MSEAGQWGGMCVNVCQVLQLEYLVTTAGQAC